MVYIFLAGTFGRTADLRAQTEVVHPMALDKAVFSRSVELLALRIPKNSCSTFLKSFKSQLVSFPKVKPIVPDGKSQSHRLLILNEQVKDAGLDQLPDAQRKLLTQHRYDRIGYDTIGYDTIGYDTIGYDTIGYDTIGYDTIRYDRIRYDTIG
eukprot:g65247.t1